jgi:hypothetical protein
VLSFDPTSWHLKDPEIGDFIQHLYGRVPHMLFFLADKSECRALVSLVAAFCPAEFLTEGSRIGLVSGEKHCTLDTVSRYLGAAADMSERAGLPRSAVAGHLGAFPVDVRHAFEVALKLGHTGEAEG